MEWKKAINISDGSKIIFYKFVEKQEPVKGGKIGSWYIATYALIRNKDGFLEYVEPTQIKFINES